MSKQKTKPTNMNLQLFGELEDECMDTAKELMEDYRGLSGSEAISIVMVSELKVLNDHMQNIALLLSGIKQSLDDSNY